jgi:hypothetical protein
MNWTADQQHFQGGSHQVNTCGRAGRRVENPEALSETQNLSSFLLPSNFCFLACLKSTSCEVLHALHFVSDLSCSLRFPVTHTIIICFYSCYFTTIKDFICWVSSLFMSFFLNFHLSNSLQCSFSSWINWINITALERLVKHVYLWFPGNDLLCTAVWRHSLSQDNPGVHKSRAPGRRGD